MASPATTPSPDALETAFAGRRWRLFWLAFKSGLWTVLTLGLYRFWMKTRLRRWYWSAIRIGGHPLEYVGDPFEKLLGFLVAVVILAFYIGIVNLVLMFLSYSLLQDNAAAYLLSFVGVIPLWFFAQYRARRYVLARTRWRGIRFGLEPGAWGYAWRAILHWLLTVASLGLLWPRMTFALEKYRTDRTFYGSARMVQNGKWTMLYPSMKPLLTAVLFAGGGFVALATGSSVLGVGLIVVAMFVAIYGIAFYRVDSLRRLMEAKSLKGVTFNMTPSAFRVLLITVFGTMLAGVAIALPASVLGVSLLAVQSTDTLMDLGMGELVGPLAALNRWALLALGIMLYFSIFLLWSALTHAFVTMPILRHYCQNLVVRNADQLAMVTQRPHDSAEEAGGFAEALDVGASI